MEAEYYQLYDLVESMQEIINCPSSEQQKEYRLIEFEDLVNLSTITVEKGVSKPLSESYDIISTVTYNSTFYECPQHGDLKKCTSNCNTVYSLKWTAEPHKKIL